MSTAGRSKHGSGRRRSAGRATMTAVGFAQTDISCPLGTPLGGNARVDKAARGVHDPLHATVAFFESGPRASVVAAPALLGPPPPRVDGMAGAMGGRRGVPPPPVRVS